MGLIRSTLAIILGGAALWLLPSKGLESATQELIAFLSLIMAGLLPAMILTATILKAAGFSAKRIGDYGIALHLQLRFWAILFAVAGLSCAGLVGIKIFGVSEPDGWPVQLCTVIAGAGLGLVIQRLWPAFQGLRSLLDLNVEMARTEAIVHDRTYRDALMEEAARANPPESYQAFSKK